MKRKNGASDRLQAMWPDLVPFEYHFVANKLSIWSLCLYKVYTIHTWKPSTGSETIYCLSDHHSDVNIQHSLVILYACIGWEGRRISFPSPLLKREKRGNQIGMPMRNKLRGRNSNSFFPISLNKERREGKGGEGKAARSIFHYWTQERKKEEAGWAWSQPSLAVCSDWRLFTT